MNTPADKPDLPVTDWYAAWSGNCLYGVYDNESEAEDEARRIGTNGRHSGLYTADTVRRLLADERRKALESIRDRLRYENMNTSAAFVQSMIDGEPTK